MALSQPLISNHFPYLPIQVEVGQRSQDIEALLDTGFEGALALPPALVPQGAVIIGLSRWILADGSIAVVPAYAGTIRIGSFQPLGILISTMGDEPTMGRLVTE